MKINVNIFSCDDAKRPNSRKCQVQMFETMAVLIVFFFLIITGMAVYFQLQKAGFKRELREAHEQASMQLIQKTLYLPELDCSFVSVQKENCFDTHKLSVFSEMLKKENILLDYFTVFGYSEITVQTIYPEKTEKVLYTNKLEEKDWITVQNPVLVYNATANSYAFGVVEVKLYVE